MLSQRIEFRIVLLIVHRSLMSSLDIIAFRLCPKDALSILQDLSIL